MRVSGREGWADASIAALAARQHGVVSRRQLVALGLSRGAIAHRREVGRLHRLHVGVYAVGHLSLSRNGRWMAAVLACGPRALLSHRSAAALWDLVPPGSAPIEVVTPSKAGRGPAGVLRRGSITLLDTDRRVKAGIPVTSVARTLLDPADVVERTRLERAFEAAERRRLLDIAEVRAVCARNAGRRGLGALLALLRSHSGHVAETRSELERRFLDVCHEHRLPAPRYNVLVTGLEVDALWPEQRVVVELDGFAWHRTRAAFERDRKRDAILGLSGHRVLRITARRLAEEPDLVAFDVFGYLAAASMEGSRSDA